MRAADRRRGMGFTLVEVLVAVGILALALPALLLALRARLDATSYLHERSVAHWIAANQLAELRIARARGLDWRTIEAEGSEDMAGTRWRWSVRRTETDVPSFFRIDLDVAREETPEEVVETLTAFMRAGAERD